jgi:hypothetical protein
MAAIGGSGVASGGENQRSNENGGISGGNRNEAA